jgi:hypothetical protein
MSSLRIEDPPTADMCRCGAVWLMAYTVAFDADGSSHTRTECKPS